MAIHLFHMFGGEYGHFTGNDDWLYKGIVRFSIILHILELNELLDENNHKWKSTEMDDITLILMMVTRNTIL